MTTSWIYGCSLAPTKDDVTGTAGIPPETADPVPLLGDDDATRVELVMFTLAQVGTPYRWGGGSPEVGFDCSGLVTYVYAQSLALPLPRTAREQAGVGRSVNRAELAPADLVFFNTSGRPHSHVGVYVGESAFVHAPNSNAAVRLDKLQHRYWSSRFDGARRIIS